MAKHHCLNLIYNTRPEEGEIIVKDYFSDLPPIMQLDCINDWIIELQDMYDAIVEKQSERFKCRG